MSLWQHLVPALKDEAQLGGPGDHSGKLTALNTGLGWVSLGCTALLPLPIGLRATQSNKKIDMNLRGNPGKMVHTVRPFALFFKSHSCLCVLPEDPKWHLLTLTATKKGSVACTGLGNLHIPPTTKELMPWTE